LRQQILQHPKNHQKINQKVYKEIYQEIHQEGMMTPLIFLPHQKIPLSPSRNILFNLFSPLPHFSRPLPPRNRLPPHLAVAVHSAVMVLTMVLALDPAVTPTKILI
jgi:hypothetical protein